MDLYLDKEAVWRYCWENDLPPFYTFYFNKNEWKLNNGMDVSKV